MRLNDNMCQFQRLRDKSRSLETGGLSRVIISVTNHCFKKGNTL